MFDAILVDGAIFLKDSLHGAKKKRGGGWGAPPPFTNIFITGSGFLKTSLHGVKKKEGRGWGGGGAQPHLQTPLSRVLRGSIWVLSLLVRRYLKRLCGGLLAFAVS